MKNAWKIILAVMLVMALFAFSVACSDKTPEENNSDGGSVNTYDSVSDSGSDDVSGDDFDDGSNSIMPDSGSDSDNTSSDNSSSDSGSSGETEDPAYDDKWLPAA